MATLTKALRTAEPFPFREMVKYGPVSLSKKLTTELFIAFSNQLHLEKLKIRKRRK